MSQENDVTPKRKQSEDEGVEQEVQPLDVLLSENPELAEVAEEDPQVGELLERSPKLQRALLQITHAQHFSGPMPHPELLAGYEKIVPGIARELFDEVKKDSQHMRTMQKSALNAKRFEVFTGQFLGFLLGITAILAGTYASLHDAQTAGTIIAGTGAASIIAAFMFGNKKAKKNTDSE